MPFKSEAQRKYLWANEPEIARDWTDTYGSRIHKDDGGIMRRRYFSGAYGQGAGDRGGDPRASAAENRAVGSGAANEAWSPGIQHSGSPLPKKTITTTPDRFPDRGIRAINYGGINVNQNKRDTQGNWGKFTTKMRGWNEEENRPNTQAEYEQARYNRQTGNRIDRLRKTRDVGKYANDPAGWAASDLSGRLAGFEKGLYGPDYTDYSRTALKARDAFTPGITGSDAAQDMNKNVNNNVEQEDLSEGWESAKVTKQDLAKYTKRTQKDLIDAQDYDSAIMTGTINPDMSKYEFQQMKKGTITEPGTYIKGDEGPVLVGAEGGLIGSVGGTSRQKYQEGNMVGAEMEGAEMEGAMMQSQEVIKELYDALIAQGLSPQEAMEKIKEIIAGSQPEGPQSPMMGEAFPGQEFGRAPAAFGGIMDTYTGRRKYGLGSFIKKAVGKVKKLASSKLGKLALMYAAGTYLGGTQALSGQAGGVGPGGWASFTQRLKDPKLLANLVNAQGTWGTAGKTAPTLGKVDIGFQEALRKKALEQKNKSLFSKGLGFLQDHPTAAILGASLGAGAYTAAAPVEGLDDTQGEYDDKKAWWDNYLASLDSDYSVNPDLLKSAQGGRVGRQEGGLMNLGGMEKDYRNDGGFVPLGGEEKADDVPARLSRNEFVFTADAVRNAGGGDIDRGAEVMENVMKNLEGGGQISEESQGQGAQEMFETSERLSEVI